MIKMGLNILLLNATECSLIAGMQVVIIISNVCSFSECCKDPSRSDINGTYFISALLSMCMVQKGSDCISEMVQACSMRTKIMLQRGTHISPVYKSTSTLHSRIAIRV